MNDLTIILSSLKSRWLNTTMSVFLTAFGVMLSLLIVQFSSHVENRVNADGRGIDIVVGAKGSPLQLILSSVYHIDIPTGNIPYDEAEKWMKHRHVKTATPLALGDNWKGYRIVGTTPDYLHHYNANLLEGRLWRKPFEAVAGSKTDLKMGDTFKGAHGLTEGGHVHDEEQYVVVGITKETGTVIDRLILTSLDSVLNIHGLAGVEDYHDDHHHGGEHDHHDEEHDHHDEHDDHHHDEEHDHHDGHNDHHDEHDDHGHHHEHTGEPEITAILMTTKSPIANINIPRIINRETILQAANPALEMARLTSMLGLGSRSFTALSVLLISIAVLNIFTGLAGSLENRMGDLAVLRAVGYSKKRIFKIIASEGMMIVLAGTILGFLMGLAGFNIMAEIVTPLGASGASIHFTFSFVLIFISVLLAGFIATLLPAIRASNVDVARQLSHNA